MDDNKWFYIGDGVHVCHAGSDIILETENGNRVYLNLHVVEAFDSWRKRRRITMTDDDRVYLGDGVYVRHVGPYVVLEVENGNRVYLTSYVVKAFEKWLGGQMPEAKDIRDLAALVKWMSEVVDELATRTAEYEVNRLRQEKDDNA